MAERSLRAYLDSSALVKLVLAQEPESVALRTAVQGMRHAVSSQLSFVEVIRAVRRRSRQLEAQARAVLDWTALRPVTTGLVEAAATVSPVSLRASGAIQLATALSVEGLDVFISYDRRLNEAADAAGLNVEAPA